MKKARPGTPALPRARRSRLPPLAVISHELRTPLNAVVGFTRLAQAEAVPPGLRRHLAHIAEATAGMLRVVDDLLDLARLEAGHLEIRPDQPLDLPDLVRQVAVLAHGTRRSAPVALYASVDASCPRHLRGDAGRLSQVLVNLLANALKFTEHGHVLLTVRPRSRSATSVTLRFAVADTGVGISAQRLPRIGQPFERARGAAGARVAGTGLGLSLVQALLERLGSELHLASVAGGGTLVWFDLDLPVTKLPELQAEPDTTVLTHDMRLRDTVATQWRAHGHALLPEIEAKSARRVVIDLAHPEAAALRQAARARGQVVLRVGAGPLPAGVDDPEGPFPLPLLAAWALAHPGGAVDREAAPPALGGLRVLALEDNLLNQHVLQAQLLRLGADVVLAADSRQARKALEAAAAAQEPFDALLLDLHLGGEHGLDVARSLRQGAPGAELPLLVLSAHIEPAEAEAARALGALDCLLKPCEPQQLLDALARVPRRAPTQGCRPTPTATNPDLQALFASQWPGLSSALSAAAAAGDAAALLDSVHALRGSLAFLGDRAATARARALEQRLHERLQGPAPRRALDAAARRALQAVLLDGDRLAQG